jgi:hypothetical protein
VRASCENVQAPVRGARFFFQNSRRWKGRAIFRRPSGRVRFRYSPFDELFFLRQSSQRP